MKPPRDAVLNDGWLSGLELFVSGAEHLRRMEQAFALVVGHFGLKNFYSPFSANDGRQ